MGLCKTLIAGWIYRSKIQGSWGKNSGGVPCSLRGVAARELQRSALSPYCVSKIETKREPLSITTQQSYLLTTRTVFQKGLERRRNHDGQLQPIEGYVEGMQTEPIGLMFT